MSSDKRHIMRISHRLSPTLPSSSPDPQRASCLFRLGATSAWCRPWQRLRGRRQIRPIALQTAKRSGQEAMVVLGCTWDYCDSQNRLLSWCCVGFDCIDELKIVFFGGSWSWIIWTCCRAKCLQRVVTKDLFFWWLSTEIVSVKTPPPVHSNFWCHHMWFWAFLTLASK